MRQLPKDLRVEFELYLDERRPSFNDDLIIYGPAADRTGTWLNELPIDPSSVSLIYFGKDFAGFSSENQIKFTNSLIRPRNNLTLVAKRNVESLELEPWPIGERLFVSLNCSKKHRHSLNALLHYQLK